MIDAVDDQAAVDGLRAKGVARLFDFRDPGDPASEFINRTASRKAATESVSNRRARARRSPGHAAERQTSRRPRTAADRVRQRSLQRSKSRLSSSRCDGCHPAAG
jgi:hypothetical protein